MYEIYMIHPFREGNGRTIREFIRQLAFQCGYIINWSFIILLNATIVAVSNNYNLLSECIQAMEESSARTFIVKMKQKERPRPVKKTSFLRN